MITRNGLLAGILILAAGSAHALDIDDFSGGVFIGTAPIVNQDLGPSSGGFGRLLNATDNGIGLTVRINQSPTAGQYSHSQNSGAFGESSIAYAMGGQSLSGDANAFRVQITGIDLFGTLRITVDGVAFALSTTTIIVENGGALPSFADFLFSDFPGVDFSNVSEVVLQVDGTATNALDASFDTFTTVCSSLTGSGGSGIDPNGNIDPALCATSMLGDFVWLDTNRNGIQDAGEPGVPGVTATLTGGGADGIIDGVGDTTEVMVTDANGLYKFNGLIPGVEYKVTFSNLPAGHEFTLQNQGGDDSVDSDADPTTGMTQIVTLAPDEFNDTLDAGIFEPAMLGNFVWDDTNGNGIQDAGEPGVPGVTATLTGGGADGIIDGVGDTTEVMVTDANGLYKFNGLIPGVEYKVTFSNLPPGRSFTLQNQGGNDSVDSDADTTTGMTQVVTLASGEFNDTLDAGLVSAPSIDVEKLTNGVDADDPNAGDAPQIGVGDPVSWTYVVTNTGTIPLQNVTVVDDQGVAVSCPKSTLAPAESMNCTASAPALDLTGAPNVVPGVCGVEPINLMYENIATASGQSAVGQVAQDTDPSHYCNPPVISIDVEKLTNGVDADDPNAGDAPQIGVGDPVSWTYVVTNTGTIPLQNVTVVDDQGVAVSCPKSTLAPGESMNCTASAPAQDLTGAPNVVPGLCGVEPINLMYENIATASGQSAVGQVAQDTDPSHYCNPPVISIDVEKLTNGVDADDPNAGDAPQIGVGDPVSWTYVVTNTGTIPLQNVTVVDDQGVAVSCPKSTLAPGESMNCTASAPAQDLTGAPNVVPGLCGAEPINLMYENIATATGQSAVGQVAQDTDPSHYCNPPVISIDVEKLTNGVDADDPNAGDAPQIGVGNPVSWTYVVTNTGTIPLQNVTVVDDQGVAVSCPKSTLAPGESMNCTASAPAQDLTGAPNVVPGLCGAEPINLMYENIATATGQSAVGQVAQDTDPSHYCNPPVISIDVEKLTNGVDADDPNAGDAPQIAPGDPVTWTYVVTNTGSIALQNVTVADDQGFAVSCPKSTLAPGESMNCTANALADDLEATAFTVVNGMCGNAITPFLYENMGTASGQSAGGQAAQDVDPSHYCNTPPVSPSVCVPHNRAITLTHNQTKNINVENFFDLDPASCPVGYVIAWAKGDGKVPIKWNHLSGSTYIRSPGGKDLNRTKGAQAVAMLGDPQNGVAEGAPLIGAAGGAFPDLPFDGVAYAELGTQLHTDFVANNGNRFGRLTLLTPDINVPLLNPPTQMALDWWNQSEDVFSSSIEYRCMVRQKLRDINESFERDSLGSYYGNLRAIPFGNEGVLGVIEEIEPHRGTLRNLFHNDPAVGPVINTGGLQPGSAVIFPLFDLSRSVVGGGSAVANERTILRITNNHPTEDVDVHLVAICGEDR